MGFSVQVMLKELETQQKHQLNSNPGTSQLC